MLAAAILRTGLRETAFAAAVSSQAQSLTGLPHMYARPSATGRSRHASLRTVDVAERCIDRFANGLSGNSAGLVEEQSLRNCRPNTFRQKGFGNEIGGLGSISGE